MLNYLNQTKARALLTFLSQNLSIIKNKHINVGRWTNFIEKNLATLSASSPLLNSMNNVYTPSPFINNSNYFMKPIMSPHLMPRQILSPPFNSYNYSVNMDPNINYRNSPQIVVTNKLSMFNSLKGSVNSIIPQGLVNPLSRFRPIVPPQINQNNFYLQPCVNTVNNQVIGNNLGNISSSNYINNNIILRSK